MLNQATGTSLPKAPILSHYVPGKFFSGRFVILLLTTLNSYSCTFQCCCAATMFLVLCSVCRVRNALKQKPACRGARELRQRRAHSGAVRCREARGAPPGATGCREPRQVLGSPREPRRALHGAREHRAQRATVYFSSLASCGPHSSAHSFWSDSLLRVCHVTQGQDAPPPVLGFPTCKMRKIIALHLCVVSRMKCDNVFNDIIMSYV